MKMITVRKAGYQWKVTCRHQHNGRGPVMDMEPTWEDAMELANHWAARHSSGVISERASRERYIAMMGLDRTPAEKLTEARTHEKAAGTIGRSGTHATPER